MRDFKEYTIWDGVTPVAVTSSTDATPIVVTATAHGFSTGDFVMINGHTTNVAANGMFKVTRLSSSTFSLQNRYTGANVAGSGGGAGASGVVVIAPKILTSMDVTNAILSVVTTGTATLTIKIAGSIGNVSADEIASGGVDTPNFGGTQSDSNVYTFLQLVDLVDASTVAGGTGLATTATDINKLLEVNINAIKYICPIVTAWTQGAITVKALLTNNQ